MTRGDDSFNTPVLERRRVKGFEYLSIVDLNEMRRFLNQKISNIGKRIGSLSRRHAIDE